MARTRAGDFAHLARGQRAHEQRLLAVAAGPCTRACGRPARRQTRSQSACSRPAARSIWNRTTGGSASPTGGGRNQTAPPVPPASTPATAHPPRPSHVAIRRRRVGSLRASVSGAVTRLIASPMSRSRFLGSFPGSARGGAGRGRHGRQVRLLRQHGGQHVRDGLALEQRRPSASPRAPRRRPRCRRACPPACRGLLGRHVGGGAEDHARCVIAGDVIVGECDDARATCALRGPSLSPGRSPAPSPCRRDGP